MESHLLQMRGLKQVRILALLHNEASHLLQMRGLKRVRILALRNEAIVASFTDAWIETSGIFSALQIALSRIFYRCVD